MSLIQLQFWELWDTEWLMQAFVLSEIMRRRSSSVTEDKLIFYKCASKFPMKKMIHSVKTNQSCCDRKASVWLYLIAKRWSILYLLILYVANEKPLCLINTAVETPMTMNIRPRYSCSAFYQPSGDKWFRGSKVFIAIQIKRNHSACELPWSVLLGGGVEGWG